MKPGTTIDVQLVDIDGNPLQMPNVSVDVVLHMNARERYRFDVGVTDARGRLSITYDMLERTRQENQAFSIMDYNTKLEDCDPVVAIHVVGLEELRERLNAARRWFPQYEETDAARLAATCNGRIDAGDVKATITSGPVTRVLLPAKVK